MHACRREKRLQNFKLRKIRGIKMKVLNREVKLRKLFLCWLLSLMVLNMTSNSMPQVKSNPETYVSQKALILIDGNSTGTTSWDFWSLFFNYSMIPYEVHNISEWGGTTIPTSFLFEFFGSDNILLLFIKV